MLIFYPSLVSTLSKNLVAYWHTVVQHPRSLHTLPATPEPYFE